MNLEIYRLMRDAETAGTARMEHHARGAIHWDGAHCLFVENGCPSEALAAFIAAKGEALGRARVLKVYVDASATDALVESGFAAQEKAKYQRATFRLDIPKPQAYDEAGTVEIAGALGRLRGLENAEALFEEIEGTWGSLERFLERGFGVCAVDGAAIAGWCLSEYNAGGRCGVGIETVEAYQKRGIGGGLTKAFVALCAERSVTPYWDSWTWNSSSVRLAEKVGFALVESYDTYLVKF